MLSLGVEIVAHHYFGFVNSLVERYGSMLRCAATGPERGRDDDGGGHGDDASVIFGDDLADQFLDTVEEDLCHHSRRRCQTSLVDAALTRLPQEEKRNVTESGRSKEERKGDDSQCSPMMDSLNHVVNDVLLDRLVGVEVGSSTERIAASTATASAMASATTSAGPELRGLLLADALHMVETFCRVAPAAMIATIIERCVDRLVTQVRSSAAPFSIPL